MKPETILDAAIEAYIEAWASQGEPDHYRRERQRVAFRNRILKMFAEKDSRIAELEAALESSPAYWERSK